MVKHQSITRCRTIERSGDAVCGLHHAQLDVERGFLGLASKPRSTVSPCLASKPRLWISRFGPQNQ
jgi:hypothetical protein